MTEPASRNVDTFLISTACREGDVVLDVGVLHGTTVDLFLRHGAARVFGIEANPAVHARLLDRYRDDDRVEVRNLALCDTDGTIDLLVPDSNVGAGSIVPHFAARYARYQKTPVSPVTVPSARLDSLGLPACDFWKIDVEGAELDLLNGAAETLKRHRPRFLQVEVFGDLMHPDGHQRQVLELLSGCFGMPGYVVGKTAHSGSWVCFDARHVWMDRHSRMVWPGILVPGTPLFVFHDPAWNPGLPIVRPADLPNWDRRQARLTESRTGQP